MATDDSTFHSWEKQLASTVRKHLKTGDIQALPINATSIVAFPTSKTPFSDLSTSINLQALSDPEFLSAGPHPQKLAALAYFRMLRTSIDQSIIISSLHPNNNVLIYNLILNQLLNISAKKSKLSKVHLTILKANTVLQAFGCTSLDPNTLLPACTHVTEFHYSKHGRAVGSRSLNYLLNKDIVFSKSGPAFLIFDLLLTDEEFIKHRAELKLNKVFKIHSEPRSSSLINLQSVRNAMKAFGLNRASQEAIFAILASILHLGNLGFIQHFDGKEDYCLVDNPDIISLVADLLKIEEDKLLECLTYKTTIVKKERYTVLLDTEGALHQRDLLIASLYGLLFAWITEQLNRRLDMRGNNSPAQKVENNGTSITLVNPIPPSYDLPGKDNLLHDFCANYTNERLQHFITKRFFDDPLLILRRDNLPHNQFKYHGHKEIVSLMARGKDCLMALLDNQTKRFAKGKIATSTELLAAFRVIHEKNSNLLLPPDMSDEESKEMGTTEEANISSTVDSSLSSNGILAPFFKIQHFHEVVTYSSDKFIEANSNNICMDFASLFTDGSSPESNPILRQIFSSKSEFISVDLDSLNGNTDVNAPLVLGVHEAQPRSPSNRAPIHDPYSSGFGIFGEGRNSVISESSTVLNESFAKAKSEADQSTLEQHHEIRKKNSTAVSQFKSSLSEWFDSISNSVCWVVFCLDVDEKSKETAILDQLRKLNVANLSMTCYSTDFFINFTFYAFTHRYRLLPLPHGSDPKAVVLSLVRLNEWSEPSPETHTPFAAVGDQFVHLHISTWLGLEVKLMDAELQRKLQKGHEDTDSVYSESVGNINEFGKGGMIDVEETGSVSADVVDNMMTPSKDISSSATLTEMFHQQQNEIKESLEKEPKGRSRERAQWVCLTWFLTWWIPTPCLRYCGGMERKDIQLAWREKLALCILIAFLGMLIIFLIAGLGLIMCPPQKVYTLTEIAKKNPKQEVFVYSYGVVYDITPFVGIHEMMSAVPKNDLINIGGRDVSSLFPYDAVACAVTDSEKSTLQSVNIMNFNSTQDFNVKNPHRNPDKALAMVRASYYIGDVVYSLSDIRSKQSSGQGRWITVRNEVFDMTPLVQNQPSNDVLQAMFPGTFGVDLLNSPDKIDWTDYMNSNPDANRSMSCLETLFRKGRIDPRTSVQCLFPNYFLLISTSILVLLMVVKFIAALQFSPKRDPEDHDRFVICMIPCYTEDKESLKKTINSFAVLKYDDKRKLLMIICDGNIIGSGNDRPTPLIVLDILGVDPSTPAPSLSFHSLGEGRRQYNMAKVYSGLYEVSGHVVPFVVVVKVGTPDEKSKPGNRGKRDCQLVLMRFLSKVAYDSAMSPMELELYHQIYNVIGVDPSSYEYVLMVDADTEVYPDSLNRMVSCFTHDSRIMGLCGETKIANEKETWTTMIQVYEYYISHHLSKAFESLFGCVTCLPGCFCMYRIKAAETDHPLLVHESIIELYSENNVDTLHKKNLLSLGEDRYLTTIMLKQFPGFKTIFTQDAICKTNVPEYWSIFLSQRRRWINSTVHNLIELLSLRQLCGCCCFSMRFVVFLDLFATLILPATVLYLGYMIYILITQSGDMVIISLILIGVVYGLQAIIFLIKRQWQHIAWMIIYMLAIPVFNFCLPLYSFWHFDDFSWGNTRIVVGEDRKQKEYDANMDFDIREIPHKRWSEYEMELDRLEEMEDDRKSVSSQASAWSNQSRSVFGGVGSVSSHDKRDFAFSEFDKRSSFISSNSYSNPFHQPPSYATSVSSHSLPSQKYATPSVPVPTFEELHSSIYSILETADLMTITKKQVRDLLSEFYQQDLTPFKDFINKCIEGFLEESFSHPR